MSSFRAFALAAALIGSAAAPAFAQGGFMPAPAAVPGPVASPAASAQPARTPLAGEVTNPAVNFLERSGATGGAGQHS